MPDKLDMSLDDIIASNKKSGRGRGGNRGGQRGGRGGGRRGGGGNFGGGNRGVARGGVQKRRPNRPSGGFSRGARNLPDVWQHDMYDEGPSRRMGGGRGGGGGSSECKLHISNLDFGVSESDIKELFAEFGNLKRATVHYDKSGRSQGTADVVYDRRTDAVKAMKQYNGVPLDGRAMKIELVGGDGGSGSGSMSNRLGGGNFRRQTTGGFSRGGQRRGSFGGQRGGGRGGRGRGRGRGGRQQQPVPTAEELDKELDDYNAQMDTD